MDVSYIRLTTLLLAIFAGVCLFIISRYIKIPAIVLLLLGGVLLGPEFLGLVNPQSLGSGLRLIISVCVAVILFEGGLTLHPHGIQKAPKMIWRLLTIGVLITWLGIAGLIYFILDLSLTMSLLAGSMVIVTGPTVIAPLLKRIQIREKLYHILHWEGVLIDPVGVFIAILVFEWLSIEGDFLMHIGQLSFRLVIGILFGYAGGKGITLLLKKEIIPEENSSIFVFASALFLFGISEYVIHEAGILTVVIAGLVIGWANPPRLKHIKKFKSDLTELAISLVFILLAANLKLSHFIAIGWKVLVVLAAVIFLVRPVSIMICSIGTNLTFNEKLFLSWIAPRGVIAGSMASLFGIQLITLGNPDAMFLETFTFSVIAATIIIQGLTASKAARLLKVEEPEKKGWLIIGAHPFARGIADFIKKTTDGLCVFLDTNDDAIRDLQEHGYQAYTGNALSTEVLPAQVFSSIGNLLAMTDNRDLNQLICEKWSEVIDKKHLFRWSSKGAEIQQHIIGLGLPVWTDLNKPSQISYDLENGEIRLQHAAKRKGSSATMLMAESQGKIFFDPQVEQLKSVTILSLLRGVQHLADMIQPQHVLFIEADHYKSALQIATDQIRRLHANLDLKEISQALINREMDFPTTLAHGVAAPHIHSNAVTGPLCVIAKIQKGLSLQTYDGEAVQLLFILISPESAPELHLRLLAEIAKIASNDLKVKQLIAAESEEQLIGLISNS